MSEIENTVVLNGREFHIEEPSVEITLRILKVIGKVAMRAEEAATRVIKNPNRWTLLFALLSEVDEADLINLGSAALQFKDDREGKRWLKENGIKVAPIVDALFLNLKLSTDLVEAVQSFLTGIEGLGAMLDQSIPIPIPAPAPGSPPSPVP